MDERMWMKARSLADAFSSAYDEDVALVLGEGLLEALAGLLPGYDVLELDEGERVFVEAADSDEQFAKIQADKDDSDCASTSIDGHECKRMAGHPERHADGNGTAWLSSLSEPSVMQAQAQHPAYVGWEGKPPRDWCEDESPSGKVCLRPFNHEGEHRAKDGCHDWFVGWANDPAPSNL